MVQRIKVICGDGGDWEFERDRFYWKCWISHHITKNFDVISHAGLLADEAEIQFFDDADATIFKLKRDLQYITFTEIKDTPLYCYHLTQG